MMRKFRSNEKQSSHPRWLPTGNNNADGKDGNDDDDDDDDGYDDFRETLMMSRWRSNNLQLSHARRLPTSASAHCIISDEKCGDSAK